MIVKYLYVDLGVQNHGMIIIFKGYTFIVQKYIINVIVIVGGDNARYNVVAIPQL